MSGLVSLVVLHVADPSSEVLECVARGRFEVDVVDAVALVVVARHHGRTEQLFLNHLLVVACLLRRRILTEI